ncbi:preprotein translocase subunit SecY [Mycoplasma suis str. Illinois]|uniref:Protein translocase subunit SecY n=1 Tax=Mycoplasma suis (strain Illinois) TaxID=768700 RepID=F0QR54_MYCSL|nr:preprotein translocase subunit SecY [Mycoplasma suis str. Illinois]
MISLSATFAILFLFQIGSHITAPLVDSSRKNSLSGLAQLLNLFGGGGFKRASIFSVGISPYITAQIIMQILSNDLIKKLTELRKAGEMGRVKIELYTRLLTLPFAIITSLGTLYLLNNEGISFIHLWEPPTRDGTLYKAGQQVAENLSTTGGKPFITFGQLYFMQKVLMVLVFVSGTYISLFLSDLISKKGLGNGISLLIVSGIISSIPENFYSSYQYLSSLEGGAHNVKLLINIFKFLIYVFFYVMVIALMVFITGSVRKIPIQQTGAGLILDKKKLGYLPIKIMPVGIMPVVFAGSVMIFPIGIAELTKSSSPGFNAFIRDYVSFGSPTGLLIYFLLIVVFSFLYCQVQFNTEEMCRSFQKQAQFIPGVMIGQETHNYLRMILNKINWFGAPFLGLVTIMPNLLNLWTGIPSQIAFGGTGILLLVSTALNIYEELLSTHIISKYKAEQELELSTLENKLHLSTSSKSPYLLW